MRRLPPGIELYDGPMMNSEQKEPINELGFAPPTEKDEEGIIRPPPEVDDGDLFLAAGGPGQLSPPPPPPEGDDPDLFSSWRCAISRVEMDSSCQKTCR